MAYRVKWEDATCDKCMTMSKCGREAHHKMRHSWWWCTDLAIGSQMHPCHSCSMCLTWSRVFLLRTSSGSSLQNELTCENATVAMSLTCADGLVDVQPRDHSCRMSHATDSRVDEMLPAGMPGPIRANLFRAGHHNGLGQPLPKRVQRKECHTHSATFLTAHQRANMQPLCTG